MGVSRPLPSRRKGGVALSAALASGLAACAGPSGGMRRDVNARIAAGDYAGAESRIERAKLTSYGRKNMVLYYLDLGGVQHDAGEYAVSDRSLSAAEGRMDELYTKSVSKEAGRFLLNDNTVEYAGERLERALVNVYRALNFLLSGDRENALVEARKLSRLLQEYADTAGRRTAYRDDAFAQYLSGLLYADGGQDDDARISFEAAARAYQDYARAYGTPAPPLGRAEDGGSDDGELVFVHANGVAPRKVSRTLQVAWNEAVAAIGASRDDEAQAAQARDALRAGLLGRAITIAYPVYVQDPYRIAASEVECEGRTAGTALVEDVSAIARQDLAERQALIRTRAVARAAIKYVLVKAATDEAKRKYGAKSWQALLTQAGTSVAAAATEVADTRAWATLPAQFRLTRLRLPPGPHRVTVRYRDAAGAVLLVRTFPVTIRKGQRAYLQDRTAL